VEGPFDDRSEVEAAVRKNREDRGCLLDVVR
jgi:hypothetical protein